MEAEIPTPRNEVLTKNGPAEPQSKQSGLRVPLRQRAERRANLKPQKTGVIQFYGPGQI
jgi:hypothetical protein